MVFIFQGFCLDFKNTIFQNCFQWLLVVAFDTKFLLEMNNKECFIVLVFFIMVSHNLRLTNSIVVQRNDIIA